MGRSKKRGLDYFAFDVDFFEDIRVRKLIKIQGAKAISVYALLLCIIYKKGYYARWEDELLFVISEKTGYDEAFIGEAIWCCVKIGLLDKGMFDKEVITSVEIQETYRNVCRNQKRRRCDMDEYCLITSEEMPITSEEMPITSEEIIFSPEETEKKESDIKKDKDKEESQKTKENLSTIVDKQKKGKSPAVAKPLEERKKDFYDSLVPYLGKYDKKMLRDFYDYWAETNDGGHKMRWEITKTKGGTFELSRRLARWKQNQGIYSSGGGVPKRGISITEAIEGAYVPDTIDMTKLLGG